MNDSKRLYQRRGTHFQILLARQTQAIRQLTQLRLFTFALGIVLFIGFYTTNNDPLAVGCFLAAMVVFVMVVARYGRTKIQKNYTEVLLEINQNAFMRMNDEWKHFEDGGKEFCDDEHPYASDLDVFGKASLFQWMSVAQTQLGRARLANDLKNPKKDIAFIQKRQAAAKELSTLFSWRQRFQAEGKIIKEQYLDPEQLFSWAIQKEMFYHKKWLQILVSIMPIITLSMLLMSLINPHLPGKEFFVVGIFFQMIALRYKKENRVHMLNSVFRYRNIIKLYEKMLKLMEKQTFSSPYLQELKKGIQTNERVLASKQIQKLSKIADSISNRNNMLYGIFNVLILWDYRSMIALEVWKEETGHLLRKWMECIAEVEVLSSMATLYADYPNWATPTIMGKTDLICEDMGHPLLKSTRKVNDVNLKKPTEILLITGSNMSGKSTLLRTVGVNLVLAYMGAPACAKTFSTGFYDVFTCMRTSDNLEQSISSFYAEILRIKGIVEASRNGAEILFLLDEIFKGTNSYDRHIGAKVLIKQLSAQGAVGLISTHDLELKDLEEEMEGKLRNYHFREYYENNQIRFDYQLRKGVSTTRNALFLIRMAGIEVNPKDFD